MSNVNNTLEKIRKPRVHIKYEVETENGAEEKDLPFVVGVMGDFSGNATEELKSIKDRKFVKIDRDNFDEVMSHQHPGASIRVENTLENDNSEILVKLQFNSLQDFEPASIVEQVPELRKLRQARDKLRDLLSKSDRSSELENILEQALKNPEELKNLANELDIN